MKIAFRITTIFNTKSEKEEPASRTTATQARVPGLTQKKKNYTYSIGT